jgi:hypothetical protein
MDLIPLNKKYYINNIEKYSEDSFIIYRDVLRDIKQYPICFCVANSKIWKEIFNINTEEDIVKTLTQWYSQLPNDDYKLSSPYSLGWALDQLQLFYNVNIWNKNIVKLNDLETSFNRLDRSEIEYIINNKELIKNNINNKIYSDFHLPKPFYKYKDILYYLLN